MTGEEEEEEEEEEQEVMKDLMKELQRWQLEAGKQTGSVNGGISPRLSESPRDSSGVYLHRCTQARNFSEATPPKNTKY